tara:strand:+ start:7822 stop:8025 length:204 start_codon:yes stop_codon:yes gene_type:complete
MYNQEILNKVSKIYKVEQTIEFCESVALLYDIKYNACKELEPLAEFDFERDWWSNAARELLEKTKTK